jgi:CDP-diacylglycerol--glycerol-3-phosphate 3-phosphatidyltransferase
MGSPDLNLPWTDDPGAPVGPSVVLGDRIGRGTRRVGELLRRARLSPGTVRLLTLLMSLAVPVVVLFDGAMPLVGAVLAAFAGVTGTVDGPMAVTAGRVTRLGVLYDPVVDRVCEVCWLAAIWLLGAPAGLVVAGGVLTGLYEYIRARAMVVGMPGKRMATVGGRGARVGVTVGGLAMAGLGGWVSSLANVDGLTAGVATLAAVFWVALAAIGLGRLMVTLRTALR